MKKIVILLAALTLMVNGTAEAQKIKGSDSVLPLAQKQAEKYLKKNANADIMVTGGGSGVGLTSLVDNTTDIAMASRKVKISERMKFQTDKRTLVETIIAWDALAVVVNPNNPVSKLTREQVEGIFTGSITNWKQVGGKDLEIVVYSRETSSGTYAFFKESAMNNKNYKQSVLSMPATGAIIQSITQTPGAIGYVGQAYLNDEVKPLALSYDGVNFAQPTYENAKSKKYPVLRPLYFYHTKDKEAKVKSFIDYVLSDEGQQMVKEVGYIAL